MTKPTSLQDRAMLVTLNISKWTNRKHDKSVSTEVERAHAAKDAGRYSKQLIDKSALEPIGKIASAARDYHYKVTLPWGDNGDRLLPSSLFLDHADQMRLFKDEFNSRVRDFVRAYPALVQSARQRLGTMYEPSDYPMSHEIADKFGIETRVTPVASASDFRVNLNQEYVDHIKEGIERDANERQVQAVKHCYGRVRDVVSKIQERLADKDAVFRDSLIENARELVKVLPHLNVTGDPELIVIQNEVETMLVSPDTLRNDPDRRSATAAKAADILSRMAGFMQ